jgi:hypothetical protein
VALSVHASLTTGPRRLSDVVWRHLGGEAVGVGDEHRRFGEVTTRTLN